MFWNSKQVCSVLGFNSSEYIPREVIEAMASQTLTIFSASFTTSKLAIFNSRNGAPPLALPSPLPSRTSSSLPTLSLKAIIFGVRPLQISDFKCHAIIAGGKAVITAGSVNLHDIAGEWDDIEDVEHNEQVQALGQFAVDEHNKENTNVNFIRVVEAQRQVVVTGVNYRLRIEGEVDKVDKVYKALVAVGLPVYPKELESFSHEEWET